MSTVAYVDSVQGFSIEVPAAWHVVPSDYEVMHYSDAFLSVNNRAPGFLLPSYTSLTREGEKTFIWPDGWGKYLEPGMVYIMFTFESGPGGRTPCSGDPRAETFDNALAMALQGSGRRTVGDVEIQALRFRKWCRDWSIVMWIRAPCAPGDRERALELLKSLSFRETPIVSPERAVHAATHALPSEVQAGPWPAVSARGCRHETRVQPVANGYRVQLVLYADESTQQIQATWSFFVHRDGSVEEIPGGEPDSVPRPAAPRDRQR